MKRKKPDIDDSQPPDALTKGEWMFLFDKCVEGLIEKGWLPEFLFYELSRELDPTKLATRSPYNFLQEISGGLFPEKPFLELESKDQENLLNKMHEPGSFYRADYLPLESPSILYHQLVPVLTDEASEHLDNHAREAAYLKASKFPPNSVTPGDLSPGTNVGEMAYVSERNRLLEGGSNIFEPGQFHLTLLLDFAFRNDAIIKEFEQLLIRLRTFEPTKERDGRGKGTKPKSLLRSLANFRLKRVLWSYESVEDYVTQYGSGDPPIRSEPGWRKSAKLGAKLVSRFKSRFEVR